MPKVKLGTKGKGVFKGLAGFLDLKKAFDDAMRQKRWEAEKLVFGEKKTTERLGMQLEGAKERTYMQTFPYKYLQDQEGGADVAGRLATGAGTEEVPLTGGEREKLEYVAGGGPKEEMFAGPGRSMYAGTRFEKHAGIVRTKNVLTDKAVRLAKDFLQKGTKTVTRETLPQVVGDLGIQEVSPGLLMYDDPIKGRQFIKTQEAEMAYKMMNVMLRAQELEETKDKNLQDMKLKRDKFQQTGEIERAKLLDKKIDRRQKTARESAFKKLNLMEKTLGYKDAEFRAFRTELEKSLSPDEAEILNMLPAGRFREARGLGRLGRRGYKPRPAFEPVLRDFDDFAREHRFDVSQDDAIEVIKRLRKKGIKLRRSEVEILMDRARQLFQ
jgi:hypothetical protein